MEPMTNSAEQFFNDVMAYMEGRISDINDEITQNILEKFLRFVRDEVCVDDERYTFDDAIQAVEEDDWDYEDDYSLPPIDDEW